MNKLNLGCGKDIREGWINLDSVALPNVDVVHDITALPLPFEDAWFDVILCKDVLEHVDYIPVLKDLHRILKPGGKLLIQVPHFNSQDAYVDPTHCRFFQFTRSTISRRAIRDRIILIFISLRLRKLGFILRIRLPNSTIRSWSDGLIRV